MQLELGKSKFFLKCHDPLSQGTLMILAMIVTLAAEGSKLLDDPVYLLFVSYPLQSSLPVHLNTCTQGHYE